VAVSYLRSSYCIRQLLVIVETKGLNKVQRKGLKLVERKGLKDRFSYLHTHEPAFSCSLSCSLVLFRCWFSAVSTSFQRLLRNGARTGTVVLFFVLSTWSQPLLPVFQTREVAWEGKCTHVYSLLILPVCSVHHNHFFTVSPHTTSVSTPS
jgi:hypothetical protein